jgi:hypothetical protein
MQIVGYWGVDIAGSRQTATALGFVGGVGSDASLNVVGTTATSPVVTVTSAAGQSGNMQEWRNSGGTVLASVNSGADFSTSGGITSSGTNGVGYSGTGVGGTITQLTDKTTGVTINKITGQITMNAAALPNNNNVTFRVTNGTVDATDVPFVAISGGTTFNYLISVVQVGAGYFDITIRNVSGASRSESLIINFAIIKGANN